MKRPLKIISLALLVIVVLIVLGIFFYVQGSPENVFKATMNEFNSELSGESRAKDVGYTISRLRYVADKHPESRWADDAQRIIADLSIGLGPEKVMNEYQKIIEKFPNSKIEEWTLENCTFTSFLKWIDRIPAADEAQAQIALIYLVNLKDYKKAIEESQKIISTYSNVTSADKDILGFVAFQYNTIAVSYKKLGDLKKAEEAYQTIIDRFPGTKAARIAQERIKKLRFPS